jgi:hypothetical protein
MRGESLREAFDVWEASYQYGLVLAQMSIPLSNLDHLDQMMIQGGRYRLNPIAAAVAAADWNEYQHATEYFNEHYNKIMYHKTFDEYISERSDARRRQYLLDHPNASKFYGMAMLLSLIPGEGLAIGAAERATVAGAERLAIEGMSERLLLEQAANATVARGGLRETIENGLGESLADREFFIHGTTAERAANFQLEPRSLFTATERSTARIFAERTVARAGGGQIGGIAVVLPRSAVAQLRALGQLTVRPISDMPHLLEWVFGPGAYDTIQRVGDIIALPLGAL